MEVHIVGGLICVLFLNLSGEDFWNLSGAQNVPDHPMNTGFPERRNNLNVKLPWKNSYFSLAQRHRENAA